MDGGYCQGLKDESMESARMGFFAAFFFVRGDLMQQVSGIDDTLDM